METIGKRRGETKGVSSNEKRIKFEKGFEKNCSNSARDINYYKNKYAICVSVHNPTDCLCFRT